MDLVCESSEAESIDENEDDEDEDEGEEDEEELPRWRGRGGSRGRGGGGRGGRGGSRGRGGGRGGGGRGRSRGRGGGRGGGGRGGSRGRGGGRGGGGRGGGRGRGVGGRGGRGRGGRGRGGRGGRGRGGGERGVLDIEWTDTVTAPTIRPLQAQPGLTTNVVGVLDLLLQLLGVFFFADLVMHTNTYAGLNNPPSTWYDTFEEEIRAFVGFNILMGIHSLPSITDFWSTDECLRVPYIANRMSRNRFEQLCRFMQCRNVTSNDQQANDKLYKVRPFIQILQQNFPKILTPWSALSVDEAII